MSDNCAIKEIDDIGDVAVAMEGEDDVGRVEVIVGTVSAVIGWEEYTSCIHCKSKVSVAGTSAVVKCEKCNTVMKSSRCLWLELCWSVTIVERSID